MLTNDFPRLLKQERRRRGWTQERLANELKIARITVHRWEHGHTPLFFYWTRLSRFLNVEMGDLFTESPNPLPDQDTVAQASFPTGERGEQNEILNDQVQALPVLAWGDPHSLWEEERLELDLEQRHLEILEKRLDMQHKWLHHVFDKIALDLNLLDSQQDLALREQVTGTILSSLEEFQVRNPDEFPIPTFQMVKEVLEAIRAEQAQAQMAMHTRTAFSFDDMRQVLEYLGDLSQLGESRLIHSFCIRIRFASENTTAMDRGRIVSQVLQEAFEHLRGNGVRTDVASAWQLYNILYYRYFKYHLKNEQVAARLGISSLRSYYRLQKKAIVVLWETFLEINAAAQNNSTAAESV